MPTPHLIEADDNIPPGSSGPDLTGINLYKYEQLVNFLVAREPEEYRDGDMAARYLARDLLHAYYVMPRVTAGVLL